MVDIYTDSTADLSSSLAKKFNIKIIPLYVLIKDKSFKDGVDISNSDLFRSVAETGQLPKTSATPVGDFLNAFDSSESAIFIGISNQLSATVKNAELAVKSLNKNDLHIVDSLNLSTGIGMLALHAAELRDKGLTAAEIANEISALVPKVRTSFVIETLEYLYKGGRCSAMENIIGSLLRIRPVITVRSDGTLGVKTKVRGTRMKALDYLLADFRENLPKINLHRVFVTHTGCDADAEFLKAELCKIAPIEEVSITLAGSVIASHCGPDTIGILYMLK